MRDSSEHREFAALVEAHGAAVFALLRRLCRHEHDAEDAFQETAARVWRSLASLPRLENPRGWLMTVAYRVFLDQRGRAKQFEELTDTVDDRPCSPPQQAARIEDACRVQAALANLPATHREVVLLHYNGGLSLQETATAMGIAAGTVKSRLNSALQHLRKVLR